MIQHPSHNHDRKEPKGSPNNKEKLSYKAKKYPSKKKQAMLLKSYLARHFYPSDLSDKKAVLSLDQAITHKKKKKKTLLLKTY